MNCHVIFNIAYWEEYFRETAYDGCDLRSGGSSGRYSTFDDMTNYKRGERAYKKTFTLDG